MMEALVTIVIPIYNVGKYLEECVGSVKAQTFSNIEILLVDDGSTDGSSEICDRLAEGDERVRVIHKENGGAASARNLGIYEAKGKYVMFLDGDDWLDKDTVKTVAGCAEENDLDVVRFNYVREFSGKKLVKRNTFLEEKVYQDDECLEVCRQILGLTGKELEHPENMNFLASCGFNMYRTELLRDSGVLFIPIQETGSFVDGLFNFCVFMKVKRFAYIDKSFYHYRKTNESAATARYRQNYLQRQTVLFEKIKKQIEENGMTEFFSEAYNNRIVLSSMEIAFNAMRQKAGFSSKYREIKSMLKHPDFKKAYKNFSLKPMKLKWKVYFFFIKYSMPLFTCIMTSIILKLKNRGVA